MILHLRPRERDAKAQPCSSHNFINVCAFRESGLVPGRMVHGHGHPSPIRADVAPCLPAQAAGPQLDASSSRGPPTKCHTRFPHATLSPMGHKALFQRGDRHIPHALLTAHHRPYSAVLSQQEPKVPLHAQPSRPTLDIIVLLQARCSPIHIRFATASYPAPGQQHAPISVTCLIPPH